MTNPWLTILSWSPGVTEASLAFIDTGAQSEAAG